MRLVFAGTPDVALPSLDALIASRHDVVAVLTRPPAPAGRGRAPRPSPVQVRAEELGLPVLAPASLREADAIASIAEFAPDCCPVVAYGALLPPEALVIPAYGWINLHFSLLPRWRGAAPVQHAIRAGDTETGATTFRIDEGLDTGPILLQELTGIGEHDTSGALVERMAASGAALLVATIDGLDDGTLIARPQSQDGVTLAPRIDADDVRIDWSAPAAVVDRLIRSSTPAPGGWTTLRGARLRLGPVEVTDVTDLAPGELRAGKRDVLVGTGSAAVRLGTLIAEGKRPMSAADWVRGLRLEPGEAFA
ncbi:MAG: methionyl-tRNA formyltransferase [Actinobacteria bacterium]|nr:methionyl-tRNA formyltransferase [Actinomycetota bacterium]